MRDNARGDTHRLQLLQQQLIRIWNLNRREVRRVPAALAAPHALLWIHHCNQPAVLTAPAAEQVRALHEALLGEFGDAVRGHTVALHLTETQASLARPALSRLPRQHHERARGPGMHLIRRAVPQALIEAGAHEDARLHLPARIAIVEHLITSRL